MTFPALASADSLVFATGAWMPYFNKVGHQPSGYVTELLTKIMLESGHSIIPVNFPFQRAIQGIYDGRVDVLAGVREDDIDFQKVIPANEEVGSNVYAFFVRKGSSWMYTGSQSLSNIRLGLISGEVYPGLELYLSSPEAKQYAQYLSGDDGFDRNIKKLIAGRVDAILDNENAINYFSHEFKNGSYLENAGYLNEPEKLYIVFSKKNPHAEEYARLFSEGIKKMRANGQLASILSRYGVEDWK